MSPNAEFFDVMSISHGSEEITQSPLLPRRGCALAMLARAQLGEPLFGANLTCGRQLPCQQQKALTDILVSEIPSTIGIQDVDALNPSDDEVLAVALGAPARRVLMRAESMGPRTGWRDGHLSVAHGFCPPDPSASPTALALSSGMALKICLIVQEEYGRICAVACRMP